MNQLILLAFLIFSLLNTSAEVAIKPTDGTIINLSKTTLEDKIKGGWAGQTIGVSYGGKFEFRYQGEMVPDNIKFEWSDTIIQSWFRTFPGLFDDVYCDLTFVETFEKYGLGATSVNFANEFANTTYRLYHANLMGRQNIQKGMLPPASGHWLNNPHADDIDFQIEADFAGIMSPGMVNTCSNICDTVGHLMNSGDGWYGGVFVGAMYSLAFVSDDIHFIVKEALKTIPEQSEFYQCINTVIRTWEKNPDNWKTAWDEVQKNWDNDKGCVRGTLQPINVDAKFNAAYVVIGLLYGEGDFAETMEISQRCGQDSDCNPATAAGIIGVMVGYSNIPAYWKNALQPIYYTNFSYTSLSLDKIIKLSYKHAIENIIKNGGKETEKSVEVMYQRPIAVKFEQNFENIYPYSRAELKNDLVYNKPEAEFTYKGCGYLLDLSFGNASYIESRAKKDLKRYERSDYKAKVVVYMDDIPTDTIEYRASPNFINPMAYSWDYQQKFDKHIIKIKWVNPDKRYCIALNTLLVYSNKPNPVSP